MKRISAITTICTLLIFWSVTGSSQGEDFWHTVVAEQIPSKVNVLKKIQEGRILQLDFEAFSSLLYTTSTTQELELIIPMPDGQNEKFSVRYAPVMAAGLAKKYPAIRSYAGIGIEDASARLRFDISHKGVHMMISSGRRPMVLIDPLERGNAKYYHSRYKTAVSTATAEPFQCSYSPMKDEALPSNIGGLQKTNQCTYKTYRLALACTGEYADFHGGNIPDVLAAMNTTMTRVNGILERDLNITLVLVEENDQLIFLNENTDPYTNGSGSAMLEQNQTTCDDIIGSANYDIGHVFSTGGGGVAYLASMCKPYKAGGVTGQQVPAGEAFDIDYVTHEMGHQLGANHTQNNDCNRFANAAVEPGSASTIMGYAGICSPNVQSNSDAYFHAFSIREINAYLDSNTGNSCAQVWDNGNSRPSITTMINYTIPARTPFVLTASASDPDGDGLTYCWEQMDTEIASMPPQPGNTVGPCFRSFAPTTERQRYFPSMATMLTNEPNEWEVLPSVSRMLNFNLTVRDNQFGGGCLAQSDVQIEVVDTGAPFQVQRPNGQEKWVAQTVETITWNVAATDADPINTATVNILLSVDGGEQFDIVLLANTPNDGAAEIIVPNEIGDHARIKVMASENIFFDISNEDFSITGPQALAVQVSDSPITCAGATDAAVEVEAVGGSAPYTFQWSDGSQIPSRANLGPGQYAVTITDSEGTSITEQIQIDTLKSLSIELIGTNLSCNQSHSGQITAVVSGGVPPYQYSWSGPGGYQGTSEQVDQLAGGSYELLLTDYRGCQQSAQIVLFDPNTRFYFDGDKDGFGDTEKWLDACYEPEGYVKIGGDCADQNSHVNPGVVEVCDGVDNNCDGQVDEGFDRYWYYLDSDGDGFGDPSQALFACVAPPIYTQDNTDCDDNDATIYPGATEICDGLDNDCDGLIDEGGCRLLIEHGSLKSVGEEWEKVFLQHTYESMIVIANVILSSGEQKPVVTRIRVVDNESFEIKVQNPNGAAVDGYSLTYLVVEEGVYNEAEHGVNLEAHRLEANLTSHATHWQLQPQVYHNAYTQAVVIGQVMSYHDTRWSSFWSSAANNRAEAPNATGLSVGKHVGEDPDTDRLSETLGYIVVESGLHELEDITFYAALGDDSVRGVSNSSTGYPYETPMGYLDCAVVSLATMKGLDGGFPVLFTEDPFAQRSKLMLAIDEDQISDEERSHNGEQVAFLAFGGPAAETEYCVAGATSAEYEWIESISMGDLTHQTGNNGGYGNFTDLEITATQGATLLYSLMPGTATNNYPEYWNIWIDFNQDGDFRDEDEEVLALESHRGMYIDQFTIPPHAKLGQTRIRVAMKWGDFSPSCGDTGWGEVEDYTLDIQASVESRESIVPLSASTSEAKWQLEAFPNPVDDLLTIRWNKVLKNLSSWRLIDPSGQVLQQQDLAAGMDQYSIQINVGHLPSSIYYIQLIDEQGNREMVPFAKLP